jgi:hypothetical protein
VPHQIALADDANDASISRDDWNTTDALGVQDLGYLWDRGLRCNRDDLARHDIGSSQQGGTSLNPGPRELGKNSFRLARNRIAFHHQRVHSWECAEPPMAQTRGFD